MTKKRRSGGRNKPAGARGRVSEFNRLPRLPRCGDARLRSGSPSTRLARALTPRPPRPLQVRRVRCESSAALVPKDKAIKRFVVRNMVDASAIRDLQDSCAIEGECWTRARALERAGGARMCGR